MRNENRGGRPFAGLTVAAILLASTAGYVSALSRMFQSTSPVVSEGSDFRVEETGDRPAAAPEIASFQQIFTRTAPAWFVDAMPGYSSGRARELWYLSLNRSGDGRLSSEAFGGVNDSTNPYQTFNLALFNNLAPVAGFAGSSGKTSVPTILNSAAPDLFWRTDGAAGQTWTGANWSNPATPTGGTSWVSGDDAFFTANSTLTFATTAVSDVTVSDNTTVTVTAAGTLTLGGVRTFDIGNNSTLTWTSQSQSAAAGNEGAGIIKNGNGTLNWGAGPGNNVRFDGGFTLNAGTVIVSGNNSFGTAGVLPATLTINGGTIAVNFTSNGDRTFANPVSLNGDVILTQGPTAGFTGNAIWTGNVALGTGIRKITNNAPTTSTRTFSGVISGGVGGGLTFDGTGITILSGGASNTYSALTTVNASELDLAKTNPFIAIPGNLTIGDGIGSANTAIVKLINSDQIANTSDVTINSDGVLNLNNNNETIDALNSSSTTASILLGSGTLTVGANNETSFAYAGTSSGSGGLTKSGSGILVLSGANSYTGSTTIKAGELMLTPTGTLAAASTIHLGDTIINSPSAMFTFGSTSGGVTLSNPLIVDASASGTEGTRTLLGLAENGNTNTYSGTVTMNTDLLVQSAAVGSTVANGQGTLLFQGGSIDVKDNVFMVNSNLRANNADTYSIQGIVRINELLGSSLATGGGVLKDGSGTLILQGTSNTYTGTDAANLNNAVGTRIGGGILAIYGDGSLGLAPTNATNNVYFIAAGTTTNTDSIGPTLRADAAGITLAPTRNINIASGVTARFDSNGNTFTIAGNINGAGNLNKVGPGILALTGANTYTGTTRVSEGTLNAAAVGALGGTTGSITVNRGGTLMVSGDGNLNRINDTTPIVLGSATGTGTATFQRGDASNAGSIVSEGLGASRNGATVTGTTSQGLGALSLQSNATFDFGSNNIGVGTFVFGNFTSNANMLTILNWTSSANALTLTSGVDGIDDRLIFAGLPTDVSSINFNGTPATFILLDTVLGVDYYEVVPVPEPSTWIGAGLAFGAIVISQRKRVRRLLARA